MQRRLLNNRYELQEPLGQGGMATVYRGIDTRLGRPVAIKLLHTHYATDEEFRRRFEHEAQSAAGLSAHPNIVDVYDVGEQDAVPFIVMELIEGSDLKAIIEREGPLSLERTLNIAQQVAEGLEYAHSRGLVHRDIKPQNIMVSPDGRAHITDFGIAKSHLSTAVTQAGMTYGTADYISPEQAQGLPASPQSDVYSLGVVVYEMLTRHLPFTGDSPMAVAVQHIQQPPPPLRNWYPTLPPSLERIVMSALAKNPRERPASARAFASALKEYRSARGQETMAVPVTPRPAAPPGPSPVAPAPQPQLQPRGGTTPMPAVRPVQQPVQRVYRPVPAAVPPPLAYPEPRRGAGIGALIVGLLLLIGLVSLAYVAFFTDTLATLFAPSPTAIAQPTAQPAASPTPAATNTPVVMVLLPDFVGDQEVDVRNQIGQLGFALNMLPPRNDPAAAGTVIEQAPAPNTTLPRGSPVTITVSLGPLPTPTSAATATPARVAIPDLTNQPFEAARVALEAAGFVVARVDEPSRTVPPGAIIGQTPPPGEVERGATITLRVSQGDLVRFPDVIGLDRSAAEEQIRATAGLTLAQVDEQGPDRLPNFAGYRPNQVVSATANGQPVDNGALIPRGSAIVLGVRQP